MKTRLVDLGDVYMIQNNSGQFWMGPKFPRPMQWESPKEPGADVPGWMTSSLEAAKAQAALLEANPEASVFERVAESLCVDAENWRCQREDPHNINQTISVALRAVAMAIQKSL